MAKSSKQAQFYDRAEQLYVEDGISLDAIERMEEIQVSRKTLYNWKEEGRWDEKKRKFMESSIDIREGLVALAKLAIKECELNPNPHNFYAVKHAIGSLKMINGIKLLEEEKEEGDKKGITPDLIAKIEKEFGLV